MDETTEKQRQYLLNIQRYLNIRTPQIQIEVSSIENIENLKTQKMLYRIVTEYLFLAQENFEYAENFKYIFDYFSINKQSKNSIRGNIENIYKAVGADGLIEFYGYLSVDATTDSAQSIVGNEDDIEKDFGDRFEKIDITDDIVNFDSGEQDDSNDINSPDLNFYDQVKLAFQDSSKLKDSNDNHQHDSNDVNSPDLDFINQVRLAFKGSPKFKDNNDD